MSGYSNKSLKQKLGLTPAMKAAFVDLPSSVPKELPVDFGSKFEGDMDFIQIFAVSERKLKDEFPKLSKRLVPNGMLWVSWPKGSSEIKTDLNENLVRTIGLGAGMVDVKVAAIDEDWSGLKFVFRLKDRKIKA